MKRTKGDYKRLGDRIREKASEISQEDYQMLQELRVSYKDALSCVFSTLNKHANKIDSNSVCTYRIKRIESIISKVKRFPDMQIHRIADIAGCRCIMTTEKDAIKLYNHLKKNQGKLPFKIKDNEKNYIEKPKESGYRSIHLEVRPNEYPEKIIEIQIRSLDQHNWATLVEISDQVFDSKLKEQGNKYNPDLYKFHQLLSKPIKELTMKEKKEVFNISGDYRYIEKIGILFTQNSSELRKKRNELGVYKTSFLLVAVGKNNKPYLKGFSNFEDAEKAYFERFFNNTDNENIVLAYFKKITFDKVSIAYSNYILTYNKALFLIIAIIIDVIVYAYNHYELKVFKRSYNALLYIFNLLFENIGEESKEYIKNEKKLNKTKKEEWSSSIGTAILLAYKNFQSMTPQFKKDLLHKIIMRSTRLHIENKYKDIILLLNSIN
nr:hypothetical protein [uncultured Capnocytophaga sp.]